MMLEVCEFDDYERPFWAAVLLLLCEAWRFRKGFGNRITTIRRVFTLGESFSGIGIGIGWRFVRCGCLHEACVLSFVPLPFQYPGAEDFCDL
jgi:hypothetical protein